MVEELENNTGKTETGKQNPEVQNPYRPYDLESGEWFFHEDVINQIKNIFENQPEKKFIFLQGSLGSGKTSTLRQIKKSSTLLKDGVYIPIYLSLNKYVDLNADDLLFSISNDAIEKINEHGHSLPILKRSEIEGFTLQSLVIKFETHLEDDRIKLLFIFDEFESLLEKINIEIVDDLIRFAANLEQSWSKYRLILAADEGLIKIIGSETINQLLDSAFKINLEEFLEEEKFKRLITEPVKPTLSYMDEAIEKIIWYSGKNLYFQQLICFYIVELLKKTNKTCGTVQVVEEAIQEILNEKRREFSYAWEKKLSPELQLMASALADENITLKKGEFYFLEENCLMNDIWEDQFPTRLKEFRHFGYFNEEQKGRFSQFPFKIPLYGLWIRKEQPFVKTVIQNIKTISGKVTIKSLIDGIKNTPERKLPPFNAKATMAVAQKWCSLTDSILEKGHIEDNRKVEDFYAAFARLLNLSTKYNPRQSIDDIIDITSLDIGILEEAFCTIQSRPGLIHDDIDIIKRSAAALSRTKQTKFTIFFYFQQSGGLKNVVKEKSLNLVGIEENDLKKIIFSERPVVIFRKTILSRLSLQKVCPYMPAGRLKTPFFGREEILNRIFNTPDTSFAIVGARRIGKTALLREIEANPPPNTIYILMDLDIFQDPKEKSPSKVRYENFFGSLEIDIKKKLGKTVDLGVFNSGHKLYKFPEKIRELIPDDKKLVFIIDEMDRLIEFDKKYRYKLISVFRAMSQKNVCQFIFAGFKHLYHSKRDIHHPFYNFCEEIILQPLDRNAALNLITTPMEGMGIYYENDNIRELLLEYTSSHPSLLQFFCRQLVDRLGNREMIEDRRVITVNDIKEVSDIDYENYIMEEVYMFYWDLSNIDRLILIIVSEGYQNNQKYFSKKHILEELLNHGLRITMSDVHRRLKHFVIRFILLEKKKGIDRYCFALPVFPKMLRERIDSDYKEQIIKNINKNKLKSFLSYLKTLAESVMLKLKRSSNDG